MKLISKLAATLTASTLTVAALIGQVQAAQHQNANLYVSWNFPTAHGEGFTQMELPDGPRRGVHPERRPGIPGRPKGPVQLLGDGMEVVG